MRNAKCSAAGIASALACIAPLASAFALPPARSPHGKPPPSPQILLPFKLALPGRAEDTVATYSRPLAALPVPERAGYTAWLRERMRMRSDRTRVAFYPLAGSGVHVSGGSQLHRRYEPVSIALANREVLRVDPHRSSGPTPLSLGYDGYAPVALVGVDRALPSGWVMGLDVGAMRGRQVVGDAVATPAGSRGDDAAGRVNPVVDVSLSFAF